jgi:hypothetical protein
MQEIMPKTTKQEFEEKYKNFEDFKKDNVWRVYFIFEKYLKFLSNAKLEKATITQVATVIRTLGMLYTGGNEEEEESEKTIESLLYALDNI